MQDIFINGRFLSQPITGVQRVAFEVVKAFDNLIEKGVIDKDKYSLVLLTDKNQERQPDFAHIECRQIGELSGHLWEQIELPIYTIDSVLLNLCGPAPIFKHDQAVIIHDAVPFACPDEFSIAFHAWYKLMFRNLCARSQELITVSDFSRKEIAHYCGIDENWISVAHLGLDHFNSLQPDGSILERNGLVGKKYVLAVGSLSPRKNFLRLVDSVGQFGNKDIELVVVGGINTKVFSEIAIDKDERVHYLGRATDEELKALYQEAFCFAFPSLYEGFGLPPVEAMSCGCPVVAADTSSIPEVCGEAALYCDPDDPGDIAEKINRLDKEEGLRKRLVAKGRERAALYTWDACARIVWSSVERLVEGEGKENEARYARAV
jgi:glycosyltransferase involved in cell wall biosynthesis